MGWEFGREIGYRVWQPFCNQSSAAHITNLPKELVAEWIQCQLDRYREAIGEINIVQGIFRLTRNAQLRELNVTVYDARPEREYISSLVSATPEPPKSQEKITM